MSLGCFSVANRNPSSMSLPLKRAPIAGSSPLHFRLHYPQHGVVPQRLPVLSVAPKGFCGTGLLAVSRRGLSSGHLLISSAASNEELKPDNIDVEKDIEELKQQEQESVEAWDRALKTFKEEALKWQNVSQEAYETYSKKAMIVLKDTSKKLKIEADKAKNDLHLVAKELSEEGKQYIVQAAENSPEPVKDVVETFASSTDEFKDVSKVLDFYIGVPYGAFLVVGGFLNFMVTGSTAGIRFGVILGGALLALSVSSLRSWRQGKPADFVNLKGQTAIAGILFLRALRRFCQNLSFPGLISTTISGAVAAFFVYRLSFGGDGESELNLNDGVESQ